MEYDDVMNARRKGVYGRRQNALKGVRIGTDIANMIYETAAELAGRRYDGGFSEFDEAVRKAFAMELPFTEEEYAKMEVQDVTDRLAETAMQTFNRNKQKMVEGAAPTSRNLLRREEQRGLSECPSRMAAECTISAAISRRLTTIIAVR